MFWPRIDKGIGKWARSLATRLTIAFLAVFALAQLVVFFSSYLMLKVNINQRIERMVLHEIEECTGFYALDGIEAVRQALLLETQAEGTHEMFYRIVDGNGTVLAASDLSGWGEVTLPEAYALRPGDPPLILRDVLLNERGEQAHLAVSALAENVFVELGHTLSRNDTLLATFRRSFATTTHIALICAVVLGWFVARRALRPVEAVTKTALAISKENLESRVPADAGPDDVRRLASAFNQMLGRIQILVREMKGLNENIAHDLRSPITRIRNAADRILCQEDVCGECQSMALSIVEDCNRLLRLVDTILDISEMNAGVAQVNSGQVDLAELLREVHDLFQYAAEDKGIALSLDIRDACVLQGDARRLLSAVGNIVDNAVKYTDAGGTVSVVLEKLDGQAEIRVADTGIGIDAAHRNKIFERFHRIDASRSAGGNGLGLSFSDAVVRSHGGTIQVRSEGGTGSVFTIRLPHPSVQQIAEK